MIQNQFKFAATLKLTMCLLLAALVIGCSESGPGSGYTQEDDGFGKIRSNSGYGTIDGISGFVHLLKENGLSVRQSSRISPRIDRYQTIIWAPDRDQAPRKEATDRLEQWVADGYGSRRLIFIGPGFRSRKLLDKKQVEIAQGENLERAQRRYSEKIIRYDYDYWIGLIEGAACDWYDLSASENKLVKKAFWPVEQSSTER